MVKQLIKDIRALSILDPFYFFSSLLFPMLGFDIPVSYDMLTARYGWEDGAVSVTAFALVSRQDGYRLSEIFADKIASGFP